MLNKPKTALLGLLRQLEREIPETKAKLRGRSHLPLNALAVERQVLYDYVVEIFGIDLGLGPDLKHLVPKG